MYIRGAQDRTFIAGEDLSGSIYRIVVFDVTTDNQVLLPGPPLGRVAGILQNNPTSGGDADVRFGGVSWLELHSAVNAGDILQIAGATGLAQRQNGWHDVVAIALQSGVAGELIEVSLQLIHVPPMVVDCDGQYDAQAADDIVHDISTEDISISFWLKAASGGGGYDFVINKGIALGLGYGVWVNGGVVEGAMVDIPNTFAVYGTTDLRDDLWHYVAVVIDRDTSANCKVFVDGSDDTSSRDDVTAIGDISNNSTLEMSPFGFRLEGRICDLKLYYTAGGYWSDGQIAYQAANVFDYSSQAGEITEYWRCDEGSGLVLYGSEHNDLALSNKDAWVMDLPS